MAVFHVKVLQINVASERTKCGELSARWVKAFVNEGDYVHQSRLRSTTSFERPFGPICVSTSLKKKYTTFLNFKLALSNPTKTLYVLLCHLLYQWAGRFSGHAYCFLSGHFSHCVFQPLYDRQVRGGWIYCQYGVLSSGRLEWRGLRCLTQERLLDLFQFLYCFALKLRLTDGR